MKSIQPEILERFDKMMKMRDVPLFLRPEYRKWVRYFLDFQAKYPQPGARSVQVRLFSEKLRSKGRTDVQVRQAADAVSLFFATEQKGLVASSSSPPGTASHAVFQSVSEQPRRHRN